MNDTATPVLVHPLRRLAAMAYDTVLLAGTLILAGMPWAVFGANEKTGYISDEPQKSLFFIWNIALIYGYFALGWCRGGRTLGMRSWRLQLVARDGDRVTVVHALRRFAAAFLAWLPLGAGVLWQYMDRDGLTWHDRLSGTRLVQLKKPQKKTA